MSRDGLTYEEDLRDAGRYFGDPAARADWIRDELRDSSSCFTCGSPDPAVIEGKFCCDCPDQTGFDTTRAARRERESHA